MPTYDGPGAVASLLARAQEEIGSLHALVTFDKIGPGVAAGPDHPDITLRPSPAENTTDAEYFLRHWQPDLLIWVGGMFRPVLLSEVDNAGLPRVLVNARADALGSVTGTWVPGMSRALIGPFQHVLTSDDAASRRLERMGVDDSKLEVCGTFDEDPDAPSCDEAERTRMAEAMGARARWLAAGLPMNEVATLLSAHRIAQRRAHRLILILLPADPRDGGPIRDWLRSEGVPCALRSAGEDPDGNTEVMVADTPKELGLWLRLAPVTYLGGTLSGEPCLHPYMVAALGSAILHGPRLGARESQIERLANAGASKTVTSAQGLGQMVEHLLPPDRAAEMAHAGWTVVAANAGVTNRLTELIIDAVDMAEAAEGS